MGKEMKEFVLLIVILLVAVVFLDVGKEYLTGKPIQEISIENLQTLQQTQETTKDLQKEQAVQPVQYGPPNYEPLQQQQIRKVLELPNSLNDPRALNELNTITGKQIAQPVQQTFGTLSKIIRLTSQSGDSEYSENLPDKSNNLHIVWQDQKNLPFGFSEIYYMKRDSKTGMLSLPVQLSFSQQLCGGCVARIPSMALDSQENMHVVWQQAYGTNWWEIHYAKLDTSGNVLINNKRLTNNLVSDGAPSIDVDSNDNIHIAWEELGTSAPGGIFYAKFDNNGNRLTANIPVPDQTTCCATEPSLAVDENDDVHIAWHDTRGGGFFILDIYYKKLDNNGNFLTNDVRVSLSGIPFGAALPSIATDQNNQVHIVWQDQRDATPTAPTLEIYYSKLDTNGNVLIRDKRLTKTISLSQTPNTRGLAIDHNNHIHISWTDDRDYRTGTGLFPKEVYYKQLNSNGKFLTKDLRMTYMPGSTRAFATISTEPQGKFHLTFWGNHDLINTGFGDLEIYYVYGSTF